MEKREIHDSHCLKTCKMQNWKTFYIIITQLQQLSFWHKFIISTRFLIYLCSGGILPRCHFQIYLVWAVCSSVGYLPLCASVFSCVKGDNNSTYFRGLLWEWNTFSSVAQSCLTLCDPMHCSTPGFPVHHQLPDLAQTHVHWVSDAIQPSHPLSSPSPPAFNLSQNQGLFQWVSSSDQVAKVLELQLSYQSYQWIFRTDFF